MKYSKAFIDTMKEAPNDAVTKSNNLMVRASIVKKIEGFYVLMPLGVKAVNKIKNKVKDLFENKNYNEVMSAFNSEFQSPNEILQFGKNHIKSYKQLPLGIYNFYDFKNDSKNILNWLRLKENNTVKNFVFTDEENASGNIKGLKEIYEEILKSVGLKDYKVFESDEEVNFAVINENGEDDLVYCEKCGYIDSIETARSMPEKREKEELKDIVEIYTPDTGTIELLVAFCGVRPEDTIKTIVFSTSKDPIAVITVGEKSINEYKVKKYLKESKVEMANPDVLFEMTGAITGYAGPLGIKTGKLLVDEETQYIYNFMAGANKTDYHIDNVNYGRDFKGIIGDFRVVEKNDKCFYCGNPLKIIKGSKFASVRKESSDIAKDAELYYLNEKGISNLVTLLSGTLDISKVLVHVIEENNNESGILWNSGFAPFDIDVCPVNVKNEEQKNLGETIYNNLKSAYNIILDDRDERAGVKFKDAELLGIPIRITVGKKAAEGIVEFKTIGSEAEEVNINDLYDKVKEKLM